MNNFKIQLGNFIILSTGADGGHKYISADIDYNRVKRKLTIFFADKADEQKITSMQRIKVSGTLMDEGAQQSLVLLDAKLVDD